MATKSLWGHCYLSLELECWFTISLTRGLLSTEEVDKFEASLGAAESLIRSRPDGIAEVSFWGVDVWISTQADRQMCVCVCMCYWMDWLWVGWKDEWISTQTDRQMCVCVCVCVCVYVLLDVLVVRWTDPTDVCKNRKGEIWEISHSNQTVIEEYDHNITLDVCFWHVIMLQIMILQAALCLHFPVLRTDCCWVRQDSLAHNRDLRHSRVSLPTVQCHGGNCCSVSKRGQ